MLCLQYVAMWQFFVLCRNVTVLYVMSQCDSSLCCVTMWQFVYTRVRSCMSWHHTTSSWAEAVCRWAVDRHVCKTTSTADVWDSPCGNAWRRWYHVIFWWKTLLLAFNFLFLDLSFYWLFTSYTVHIYFLAKSWLFSCLHVLLFQHLLYNILSHFYIVGCLFRNCGLHYFIV